MEEEVVDNRILHHQIKKLIEKMSFSDDELDKSPSKQAKTTEADKGKKTGKETARNHKKEILNFAGEM